MGWKPKYFSDKEIFGLSTLLVMKLDRARELYGHPIIITSGFRTEYQNDAAGGVKNSAHLTGLAVDLKAPADQSLREKLAWALGASGFLRIGPYPRHFHADIDDSKAWPAFFPGDYA